MLTVDRVAALHRVDLFRNAPGRVLAAVAHAADELELEADEPFIVEGTTEDSLYVIVSGRVRVHRGNKQITEVGPGSTVGEMAVLQPEPRSASVTTVTPARLLRLRKRAVDDLLVDHPELAASVIAALVSMVRKSTDLFVQAG